MTYYMKKALDRLHNPNTKGPQYVPHRWSVPDYGKILQMASDPDEINLLDKKSTKIIKSILGNMLYYEWSVDPTMIQAIIEISRVQLMPTRGTEEKIKNVTRLRRNLSE